VFFILQPFLQKYGKRVLLPGIVCVGVILYFFLQQDHSTTPAMDFIETIPIEEPPVEKIEALVEEQVTEHVFVDVKGAVNYPGVYELTTNDRIVDAIEQAGGYAATANPVLINHAQKLQDEMVIYIPQHGEELAEVSQQLVQVAGAASGGATGATSTSGKVNINKADEAALTSLPGIGPAKANAIVSYRAESGNFQSIEDLKKVSGIGDKSFEQLKDLIDVK
jgi:competence protein ComEA